MKEVFHSSQSAKKSELNQGDLKLLSVIKAKSNSIINQNMKMKYFVIFF
jgi:hypothetical protein